MTTTRISFAAALRIPAWSGVRNTLKPPAGPGLSLEEPNSNRQSRANARAVPVRYILHHHGTPQGISRPMSDIIGIDLGTTNSAAAYMTDAGPKLIPNALGDLLTPSVVGIDPDNKLLVGRA